MTEIKTFWIEGRPTVDDIKQAYEIVANEDVVVMIKWFVNYNGMHERLIFKKTIQEQNYTDYWENYIPHCYGV